MSKHIITLDPAVIKFLQEHGHYGFEVNGETHFDTFKFPNWVLLHRELNEFEVKQTSTERFFFVSYNGLNPEDGKTVIGHLAFSHQGYPSLLYITEVLIPQQSKVKITDTVITLLHELDNQQDFDEFTTGRDMGSQLGDKIGLN